MLTSRSGPAVGLIAQLVLLAALQTTVGLSLPAWLVGLGCGVLANTMVARELARTGGDGLGPADRVTLVRATLACGVAALVADSFVAQPAVPALVALSVAALVLDAVDGWVARRTRTASPFGARFDGEVDAFLIAVLSVYVARSLGWWVLAIGAARYLFAVAGWALPWLRRPLPPRYWRKVVAATEGIVLTVAAADVVPRPLTYTALAVGLVLLAESFGRDVWWSWRHRHAEPAAVSGDLPEDLPAHSPGAAGHASASRRRWVRHPVVSTATNVLALLLIWFALVAPNRSYRLAIGEFLRIPVEGLVVAGLALVLPPLARRVMAAVVGVVLALLTILKLLDMGFFEAFDRPFNVVSDRGYLGPAIDLARDSIGSVGAVVAVIAVAVLALAVLVCVPLAVSRLTTLAARHRGRSLRALAGLVVVCVVTALSGLQVRQGEPIASTSAGSLAVGHVRAIAADAHEEKKFDAAIAVDRFRDTSDGNLLAGLRGKDVLLIFVESYGRIAIDGSPSSPEIRDLLDDETGRLRASGFSSASGFLTSSTFGGLSWLAHGTLQSGLWVDNQRRYDELLSGNRLTLSRAFGRAGWRSVAFLPSNVWKWPRGRKFYQFDKIYDKRDVGYRGPRFGFSKMPDQYAMSAFQRLELGRPRHAPLMAEIDLASSHTPWAKIPRMIAWNRIGDGSIFNRVRGQEMTVRELWSDPDDVEAAYAKSIAYSLHTVFSFLEKYGDENLVTVVLGDHQPGTVVTGHGASRDVPISIIAKDRTVIDRISGWGWPAGLRPDSQAPVWRMDAFRDRFFAAFSP